jgi:hypothetical protein
MRRHPIAGFVLAAAFAALSVGCRGVDLTPPTSAAAPRPGPVISLAATRLSWTTDTSVRYLISNPDGVGIYWGCPLEALQYYRNGWQMTPAFSGACLGDYPTYVRLAPGDSIVRGHGLTNDVIPQSGWYRFIFQLCQDSLGHQLWQEASRISPAFYVGP